MLGDKGYDSEAVRRLAVLGIAASPPRSSISLRTASLSSPLSPSICSGSQSISRIRTGKAVTSCACPGVITTPIGRPSELVRALILVEKPPRERPSALRSVPLFHRRHNDAPG